MGGRGFGKKTFRYNRGKKRAMRSGRIGSGYGYSSGSADPVKTGVVFVCVVLTLFDIATFSNIFQNEISSSEVGPVLFGLMFFGLLTFIAYFVAYKLFKDE